MKTFKVILDGEEDNAVENVVGWYVSAPFLVLIFKDGSTRGVQALEFEIQTVSDSNDTAQ